EDLGPSCPPKPHPRSLSTSWRGRAQRLKLSRFGKMGSATFPPLHEVERGPGGEASKGRKDRGVLSSERAALPALGRRRRRLGLAGGLLLAAVRHDAAGHEVAGGELGGVGRLHPLELVLLQVALLVLLAAAAPAEVVA